MDEALALARRLRPAIDDERVLAAIASVPRELFIGDEHRGRAYENVALPIAGGQTISQPIVVARMLELLELRGDERVLDVGTGSGYHAALLAGLAREVLTIELLPELSAAAEQTLARGGYDNVTCLVADGSRGLPETAPFDAINVAAACGPQIPRSLVDQLALGGRLVAPVGTDQQYLTRCVRTAHGVREERFEAVRFVALVHDGYDQS